MHKKSNIGKPRHLIGRHGAVGFVTSKGSICAECGKPIKETKTLKPKLTLKKLKELVKRINKI